MKAEIERNSGNAAAYTDPCAKKDQQQPIIAAGPLRG